MPIYTSRSLSGQYGISYSLYDPENTRTNYSVTMQTSWPDGDSGRKGEILNLGGGDWVADHNSVYTNTIQKFYRYGSYVFVPNDSFIGLVHMWGAGGGGYYNSGDSWAGGGGYSQAIMRFEQDIPYTIVVGEAGHWAATSTHGGGGRGHGTSNGGSGGGLSGIFFNTYHTGRSVWGHGTPPVSQSNALIIAGGGGGKGHHNQAVNFGNAGGGGGWIGKQAHNATGGTQTAGGAAGYSNAQAGSALHGGQAGNNASWLGGGGGGWYGGGGGGHSGVHHNGGAGGSGHIAYSSSIASQPNNNLSSYIIQGFLEKAPGTIYYGDSRPANFTNPLNITEGRHGGQGGYGEAQTNHGFNQATWNPRNGKVVITLLPDFMNKISFPSHTSFDNVVGWTQ